MSVTLHTSRNSLGRLAALACLPVLVLAVLGAMMVTLATNAAAHDTIIDADPAADAVLDTAPTEIVLTYSAEVLDLPAAIVVTDSDGEVVGEGEPTVEGRGVILELPSALANGTYEVLWSVVSSDGHRTEDRYNFTVASESDNDPQATTPGEQPSEVPTAEPTTQAPPASPAAEDDSASSSTSGWPIAAVTIVPIGVLVIALVAALVYRRRRQG